MARPRPDALIIGAGISGLTTAVRLAQRGLSVRIVAKETTACSTSANAGAIWDPIYATHDHVPRWSGETYEVLARLVGVPRTGVRMVDGVEASRVAIPHRRGPKRFRASANAGRASCPRASRAAGATRLPSWTCPSTCAI